MNQDRFKCTFGHRCPPNWKPGDGTLTKMGWTWKCLECGEVFSVMSDNFVQTRCDNCGGSLIDAPIEDAMKHESIWKCVWNHGMNNE